METKEEIAKKNSIAEDARNVFSWQQNRDAETYLTLVKRFRPITESFVKSFKTSGVSPLALRAQADSQFIKAISTYKPGMETAPSTHIWNNLQKIKRVSMRSLQSGHIPEHRNIKKSTFVTVKDNLTDRLGYEPSVQDLSEELGWSMEEVARMDNELGSEIPESTFENQFYKGTDGTQKEKALADYLYMELDGKEKKVFEWTFGYGGKPILNSREIAKKIGENEMYVSRTKKKLSSKLTGFGQGALREIKE
jgi:DNA-directed RNA polymerase specialized sigma subunit